MQRQHLLTTSIVAILALAIGFGLSGLLFRGSDISGKDLLMTNSAKLANFAGLGKLTYRDSLPPKTGHAAIIDLDKNDITLYEGGLISDTYALVSTGAIGSPWETPAGRYKVLVKEISHSSPLAKMNFPDAVQIFGNTFIHGDPYKTKPGDSPKNTFGSIHLKSADAAAVYRFLSTGDVVIVKTKKESTFVSVERLASIGALIPAYTAVPKSVLRLNSLSYYIADLDTGEVIMNRDEDKTRSIASISKLFTTLVATEDYSKDNVVQVSQRALTTLGTEGELFVGERMGVNDALYPLLLESSNDMAEAIAESFGRDQFIAKMNEKAKTLKLAHTSFGDPSGLSSHNVSSAKDLFTLAQYLYKFRPDVLNIAKTYSYTLKSPEGAARHVWTNHNKFVLAKDDRYIGGKTGYIDESGLTSVSLFSLPLAEFSKKNIGIVLLNSANRDRDNKLILNQLYDSLVYDKGVTLRTVAKIPTESLFANEDAKDRASLIFLGTIALPKNTLPKSSTDFMKYFANSGFLKDSNVGITSIIGPVSDVGYDLGSHPSFKAPSGFAKTLHDAGVTVASLATSHAGDWGRGAIGDTVTTLASAGVTPVGIGRDATEAGVLRTQTVSGMTVGFLNVAIGAPAWLSSPSNVPVINSIDPADISSFLETVRNSAAKVQFLAVIYNANAGAESIDEVGASVFAKSLIDAGAKIVIGVGPHEVGSIERYKDGVIAYSLGDFIYDPALLTKPFQGIALEVLLQGGEIIETNGAIVKADERGIPYLSEDDL
ncbi:MAG: CapA family protein [Candidatus Paceibacterota bacterium]|jgi:D-alanyl-D-alanine carboxypeptidase